MCQKKCHTKVSHEQRNKIHDSYIDMNYKEQGVFIKCMLDEKEVQRRLLRSNKQRQNTYVYHLKVDNDRVEVCKSFFLTTFGYNAKNDARIRCVLKKQLMIKNAVEVLTKG